MMGHNIRFNGVILIIPLTPFWRTAHYSVPNNIQKYCIFTPKDYKLYSSKCVDRSMGEKKVDKVKVV